MLLAIDIGNTNLVIGCIQEDRILFKARIATDRTRTSDQYGVEIKNMIEAFGVNVMDVPSQVGSDRIVIAVAALAEYRAPLILMDMGTATTIEVVEPENHYMGGIIFPGVKLSLDALTGRAAQLPGISLDKPKQVIGKNTVDCMRSGMLYGTAAMIDGLIDRMEEELGHSSTLIATGGMAQFVTPLCKHSIILEKDLLLKGLNIIYKKNKR